MAGFRKSHSTCTILLKIKDDIMKALKCREVTAAVFSDYSKAFDTVDYLTLLDKLSYLGFSKPEPIWMTSYLTQRKQFVQINDKRSSFETVPFGVPQGSVLGPLLFNVYTPDLQDNVKGNVCQFADDTTLYHHVKPCKMDDDIKVLQKNTNSLYNWSCKNNLLFNAKKTKTMLFGSKNAIANCNYEIKITNQLIEQVKSWKVLGVWFDEKLSWSVHFKETLISCYRKLSVLKRLKRFTPFHVRKQLAESLILSVVDYCSALFTNAQKQDIKRIQKLQNACCSFVLNEYCRTKDVTTIGWLPIDQRIKFSVLKLTHKSLYVDTFPRYMKLEFCSNRKSNRLDNINMIHASINTSIFAGNSSRLFNLLPNKIRTDESFKTFSLNLKNYLLDEAIAMLG